MIRRQLVLGLALGTSALLMVSGCSAGADGGSSAASSDDALADLEPISLTMTDLDFETGISPIATKAWMDEVTEKTDGKVTFETFYGASLIPAAELVSGLSSGLADIGFITPALAPDQLPVSQWMSRVDEVTLPNTYPEVVLSGIASSIPRVFSDGSVRAELDELNLVPLTSTQFTVPLAMLCTKPVTTPSQADGLSVRVGGQPWTDVATAMGMTPVSLPHSEVYEALQRGIVDCAMTIPSTLLASGIMEIGTDLSLVASGAISGPVIAFNKDSWDSLPPVVQQIMYDAVPLTYETYAKTSLDQYGELIAEAEERGIEVTDAPELDEKLDAYRDDLAETLPGTAPAGVEDPAGFISEFESTVADTESFMSDDLGVTPVTGFDELITAYSAGSENIDWSAYRAYIAELLEPYRPAS